jgi:hypothetical protein
LQVGFEVAGRLRFESTDEVAPTLDPLDWAEMRDLVVLLAAAVDISAPPSVLFGWWRGRPKPRPELRPCGTIAAANRHKYRGEEMCEECRDAIREWDRARKRLARAA